VLVLDTEVYSIPEVRLRNLLRAAQWRSLPRRQARTQKDLGLIAMSYGNIYVASVAMGAKDEHTLNRFSS